MVGPHIQIEPEDFGSQPNLSKPDAQCQSNSGSNPSSSFFSRVCEFLAWIQMHIHDGMVHFCIAACVCLCVCVCLSLSLCILPCLLDCVCVCQCVCVRVCGGACISICMYVRVCQTVIKAGPELQR